MRKLTKTQVVAIIKKTGTVKVWLCPSKCFPNIGNPFNIASEFDLSQYSLVNQKERITRFERTVNDFHYFNCNSELGNTVHYYIEA